MKLVGRNAVAEASESFSLCTVTAAGRHFGVDTRAVFEVLGRRTAQRVPLAPAFIGGMVAYRGEVLTTISLRALLGHGPAEKDSYVLVMQGETEAERLGLMVDEVGGVISAEAAQYEPNPAMLDEVGKAVFAGAFRLEQSLLIKLEPELLQPSRLLRLSWLKAPEATGTGKEEAACAH